MFLLGIVALISTWAFYSAAKQSGIHAGKFASLPLIALGLLLIAEHFASPLLATFLADTVNSEAILGLIAFAYNLFLISIYLVFIRHIWRTLHPYEEGNDETDG